jgi:hypothetical protein
MGVKRSDGAQRPDDVGGMTGRGGDSIHRSGRKK